MEFKKLNDRTLEVHFPAQGQSVFYYAGLVDPEILAKHPETLHICLVRFPKEKEILPTTYQRRKQRRNLNKQIYAYLDRKHTQLVGKPFPRNLVSIFADPTDGTIAQRQEFLEGFAEKHSSHFKKVFTDIWLPLFIY
jgi:hypothetical protein